LDIPGLAEGVGLDVGLGVGLGVDLGAEEAWDLPRPRPLPR